MMLPYSIKKSQRDSKLRKMVFRRKSYALCTIHRAENTDDKNRLQSILYALSQISKTLPIILPLHPRTKKIITESSFADLLTFLNVIDPISYIETQRLEMSAKVILTDSGGMQKEAFFHEVPCITLRDETEWVETVQSGWNQVVGTSTTKIMECFEKIQIQEEKFDFYGDGNAASKIIDHLTQNP